MQRRRVLLAVGGLALAATPVACSDSGGTPGIRIAEVPVQVDRYDTVAAAVGWQRGFLAVTAHGLVYRSDGERWIRLNPTGLVDGLGTGPDSDESSTETRVDGLAAGDGLLLAVGTRRTEITEDDIRFSPLIWRSTDGENWETVAPAGLTAVSFDFVVADGDGFVAFGTEEVPPPPGYEPADEAEGELPATIGVTSAWRSADGTTWEKFGANVLPPGENSVESVASVAIAGDQLLASLGTECTGCYDDYNLVLARSDDGGGTWQELDQRGLDDVEQANTDVIPRLATFDEGFVAVATSGDGDDTEVTLWRSSDGENWTDKTRLGGPGDYEYGESIDAVAATDTGVIALELRGNRLFVWEVDLR